MESVFQRFDSYHFEADRRFVDGLKSLNKTDRCRDAEGVLDLKLFFYNRFVEPIDGSHYKQQKSSSPSPAGDQRASSPSHCDVSRNPPVETPKPTQTEQLSFAEVMRLVQEGKEVPGVTKLDVQPSNQSPTSSQMTRILKPWETA